MLPSPRPAPATAGAGERNRIWIENDLTGKSVIYRSEDRFERPIPGGVLRDVREWRIDLSKEPPYKQVIDLITTWTFVRAGRPDVRFVYRVRTDERGPKATVDYSEGKFIP